MLGCLILFYDNKDIAGKTHCSWISRDADIFEWGSTLNRNTINTGHAVVSKAFSLNSELNFELNLIFIDCMNV